MARAKLYETILDAEGDIIVGATVTVRQPGTSTAIVETMYQANTGGTTLTNPLTSTSDGSITFYLDAGRRVDLFVQASGYADKTLSYVPVLDDPADIEAHTHASTMTLIASATPNGADVDFTSIPATYRYLVIYWSARSTRAGNAYDELYVRFNGDTGANYHYSVQEFTGFAYDDYHDDNATQAQIGYVPAATAPSNRAGVGTLTIQNYVGTTFQKSATSLATYSQADTQGSNGWHAVNKAAITWKSTAAISRVQLFSSNDDFLNGSRFDLYGIL